jgi:hypothetical protein
MGEKIKCPRVAYGITIVAGVLGGPLGIVVSPAIYWLLGQELQKGKGPVVPPEQRWIGWASAGIFIVPLLCLIAPWPTPKPPPPKEAEIPASALTPYTQEEYPKLFAEYGSRIEEVEIGRKAAAQRAARSGKCDKVSLAELSGVKSTLNDLHWWVDCENGQRFFFTEDELRDPASTATPQESKAVNSTTAIQICAALVKQQANNPSTVSINSWLTSSGVSKTSGNTEVIMPFSAKNSFGLELKFNARCLIPAEGNAEITIVEQS